MRGEAPSALQLVRLDPEPEHEAGCAAWQQTTAWGLLDVPGYLWARRYVGIDSPHRHLAPFELEGDGRARFRRRPLLHRQDLARRRERDHARVGGVGLVPLPMPLQTVLMDDLTFAAEAAGRHQLINNPAGQIAGMLREHEPAAVILKRMASQAAEVIASLKAYVEAPVVS